MTEGAAVEAVEDLFDAVDTVARLVGGPVALEDVDFRVLAYSAVPGQPDDEARRSAILNRRTPDRWLRWMDESGFREKLAASEDVVRLDIPWTTFQPRYIQPVRTADRLVGYLWLMQGESPLAPDFARTARDAARLLAPELTRRSRLFAENPGGQMLRQFLGGALPASRVADHLGVEEKAVPTVILAMEVAPSRPTAEVVTAQSHAVRALALGARFDLRDCLVGAIDQRIYLMHCGPPVDGLLGHAVDKAERAVAGTVFGAAGGTHAGLRGAQHSRREADDALRVLLARPGGPSTGEFASMRHMIVLHEVADLLRTRPTLVDGLIGKLVAHDAEKGTGYVPTLETYLDAFGDVRAAAERLHIHPNSLRYRLGRVGDIAGLGLDDPDLRLALHLALRARDG